MNSSLSLFRGSINTIKEYLNGLYKKNELLDNVILLSCAAPEMKSTISDLQIKRTGENLFIYSIFIISLYGYYETFIERIIKEYLEELKESLCHFSQLPSIIKDNYFGKGVKLHSKLTWQKYNHLNERDIAKSLYDSLNKDEFNLIPEVFFSNAGNYNFDILSDCLGALGIVNCKQEICNYNPLYKYYLNKYGESFNPYSVEDSVLYGLIDEVVDTRNLIAHTGNVTDIKDKTYIEEMINFFELFADSLNLMLQDNIFRIKWELSPHRAFTPINYFGRVNVVGFRGERIELHLNQDYICKFPNGIYPKYTTSKVLGLQECGIDFIHYNLYESNPHGVGIKIGHKASEGCQFKFF